MDISKAVNDCGVKDAGTYIERESSKFPRSEVNTIEGLVQVVIGGADVFNELVQAFDALDAHDYHSFGLDISHIIQKINHGQCTSPFCVIIRSIFRTFDDFTTNLGECKADFSEAEAEIESFAKQMKSKEYFPALQSLSRGFEKSSATLKECDLIEIADLFAEIAYKLGLHKIEIVSKDLAKIIVTGENIFDNLDIGTKYLINHDYKNFGEWIGRILEKLSPQGRDWKDQSCDSPICYIIQGLLESFDIFQHGRVEECKNDLEEAWVDVKGAFDTFAGHESFNNASVGLCLPGDISWNNVDINKLSLQSANYENFGYSDSTLSLTYGNMTIITNQMSEREFRTLLSILIANSNGKISDYELAGWFDWWHNTTNSFVALVHHVIEEVDHDIHKLIDTLIQPDEDHKKLAHGLAQLGDGLNALSSAVKDCEMEKIAVVVEALASKLHLNPVVGFIHRWERRFKIIMDSSQIYELIYDGVKDYSHQKYYAVGYDLGRLAVKLVKDL